MTQDTAGVEPGHTVDTVRRMAFGPLQITYHDRVLTPRPWTRQQSQWAAELMPQLPAGPVLELCCGAGQIGLLATALTPPSQRRTLVAVDLNAAAVALATTNATAASLEEWVEVRQGDLAEVVGEQEMFSLVIADPPWVPHDQLGRFPEDPQLAIDGGTDGLAMARRCLTVAQRHLQPGGLLLLQLGTGEQVARLDPAAHRLRIRATRAAKRGVLALLAHARE